MELENMFASIVHESQPAVIPFWRRPAMCVAATILLILGGGYFAFFHLQKSNSEKISLRKNTLLREMSPVLATDYTEITNENAQPRTFLSQDSI
ncbi:hypothetical protein [Spirosoma sp.]|uniref:hypothetical protein n=1 Tax=Spirosoma sp. TaxID=1899569 RepID=UPI003B3BA19D